MNVFIDTNIFLSFYHLTSEDLEELKKLVLLIRNETVFLHLTRQVLDEAERNRASKINDSFATFKKTKMSVTYPAYCKGYSQYNEMKESQKVFDRLHAEIVDQIQDDIDNKNLGADILIRELYDIAAIIERTPELIDKAKVRIELGNPPGKKGSLGDAINWESLLSTVKNRSDIHIIADDSDFSSPLNSNKINEFLESEWKEVKKSNIYFYRKLSDFFRKHYPQISLQAEAEKDDLISRLAASSNFSQTHILINELAKYSGFSPKQAQDLVDALFFNNQINWIIKDENIHQFYLKLAEDNYVVLERHISKLEEMLEDIIMPF